MVHGLTTARRRTIQGRERQRAGAASTVGAGAARSRAKRVAKSATLKMRILVIHRSAEPADITRAIGLTPSRRGDARSTPKGTRLEGVWRDTRWSHTFDVRASATADAAVATALDRLTDAGTCLAKLRRTGGPVELIISTPGGTYQGASLGSERLRALADLGIGLGIEVFPGTIG